MMYGSQKEHFFAIFYFLLLHTVHTVCIIYIWLILRILKPARRAKHSHAGINIHYIVLSTSLVLLLFVIVSVRSRVYCTSTE
jgi:hypothetical protein